MNDDDEMFNEDGSVVDVDIAVDDGNAVDYKRVVYDRSAFDDERVVDIESVVAVESVMDDALAVDDESYSYFYQKEKELAVERRNYVLRWKTGQELEIGM